MKPANLAPVYCALYPQLAEVVRLHGYALAIHGSLGRDFDLICIPWDDRPSPSKTVVEDLCSKYALKVAGEPDTVKHGRERWTLIISFGDCFVDLSFMPVILPPPLPEVEKVYTHKVRRWCSGDQAWSAWERITVEQAARYSMMEKTQVRALRDGE